jgi:hypothetical protein
MMQVTTMKQKVNDAAEFTLPTSTIERQANAVILEKKMQFDIFISHFVDTLTDLRKIRYE